MLLCGMLALRDETLDRPIRLATAPWGGVTCGKN